MNLLFLADLVQPDAAGGAQTVAWELGRRLVGRGHNVNFIVTAANANHVDAEIVDGIQIRRLPKGLSPLQQIRQRQALVMELSALTSVDLVHSHFAYSELGVASVLPGCPWVRSFYGPWDEEGWVEDKGGKEGWLPRARTKKWLRGQIEQMSLRRADRILFLSEFSRTQLNSTRVDLKRQRHIPGGCDIQRFYPEDSRAAARNRLSINSEGPLLFSLRRLVPRMGLDRLIEAIKTVREVLPTVRLIIGGRGPESQNLQRKIDEGGLQNHIQMAGFIPDELLADYYRAADLFVLPTTTLEGFGLVTVDALACGTPVLGTPAGATPEILTPLDARLITSGIDASDLGVGILQFFKEDWSSALSPQYLHAFVRDHYTWELHTEAVLNAYGEVLKGNRSSATNCA